jgi:hypothetical protein
MPLTAYSISAGMELDVKQLLARLSDQYGLAIPQKSENIPELWRDKIRTDIECPSCFIVGAEIVREANSRSSGKVVRQPCFRFSSPSHHPLCDFSHTDNANVAPENMVMLGSPKSALTRAVGDLVCAGIHLGIFNQKSIRDMREWFFLTKSESSFTVTLDPKTPKWIDNISRSHDDETLLEAIVLTKEITSINGFDFRLEARRTLRSRHRTMLKIIRDERIWVYGYTDRIESLARKYQGQSVFDPSVLKEKYEATKAIATFISQHYAPIQAVTKSVADLSPSVLAFSALLLFISEWNFEKAVTCFATVAAGVGHADSNLGNVMGLNPFHDYEAWRRLKRFQELGFSPQSSESFDVKTDLDKIEAELRSRFSFE